MNRTTDAPRNAASTPALPAADGRMGYFISEDGYNRLLMTFSQHRLTLDRWPRRVDPAAAKPAAGIGVPFQKAQQRPSVDVGAFSLPGITLGLPAKFNGGRCAGGFGPAGSFWPVRQPAPSATSIGVELADSITQKESTMNRTTDAPRNAASSPALPAADGRMGYFIREDGYNRLLMTFSQHRLTLDRWPRSVGPAAAKPAAGIGVPRHMAQQRPSVDVGAFSLPGIRAGRVLASMAGGARGASAPPVALCPVRQPAPSATSIGVELADSITHEESTMNRTTDAPRNAASTPALSAADGRMGYFIREDDHQRLHKVMLLAGLLAENSNDEALAEAAESVAQAVGRVHNNAIFGTGWVDLAGGVA